MRASLFVGLTLFGVVLGRAAPPSSGTMIFFDWGKSTIDREDAAQLDAFAASFLQQPGRRVLVESHSDRSGSAAANLVSSRVRAEAVRDHLVVRGIPAGAIETLAVGEERPLIPTADGVREAQNRRVDVRVVPLSGNSAAQ